LRRPWGVRASVLPLITMEAPTSHSSAMNSERRSHIFPSFTRPAKSLRSTACPGKKRRRFAVQHSIF
jgi:hypothetical protein